MKIMVGTPTHSGNCTFRCTQSMMELQKEAGLRNIEILPYFLANDALITRARNYIVKVFLKTDADYLLFIDSDIGFDASQVLDMVNENVDVIGGIYPKKGINWSAVYHSVKAGVDEKYTSITGLSYVVNTIEKGKGIALGDRESVEVENIGTGMMLIRRDVFERMNSSVTVYLMGQDEEVNFRRQFPASEGEEGVPEIVHEYFGIGLHEDGTLMSEDYYFCDKFRKVGGKIYAAPWVILKHTGSYTYGQ
jgi:hypothetical protein